MRGRATSRSGQSPKPLTPTLSALERGEGELRLPSPLGFSGRGFNLFKGLQPKFRATESRQAANEVAPLGPH
jgi:hypothetical protein